MKLLRKLLDTQGKWFAKGGKLEKFEPLYEAIDTCFYSPANVTRGASHVRDALDLKRLMGIVVIALIPCVLVAMYNTGYQASRVISEDISVLGWQGDCIASIGLTLDGFFGKLIYGALFFIPVYVVTMAVGGSWEVLFAIVRRHEVNEGFFVTGLLFPLILPATIPLWQVAVGISFGVVLGKEIFGGTGMNIFNPALLARAFLFFAYPGEISGDEVWVSADGFSGPTMMATAMVDGTVGLAAVDSGWLNAFLGLIPGSMGETSTLACLLGGAMLLVTRIASWRVMLGVVVGSVLCTLLLNSVSGYVENPYFGVPFWWHCVLGGWAFGMVFMATDPVTSAHTETGKLIYGFCIGILAILIRVANPAYPEGMMLAILFMNCFAALIDHYVLQANIKRRLARHAATV